MFAHSGITPARNAFWIAACAMILLAPSAIAQQTAQTNSSGAPAAPAASSAANNPPGSAEDNSVLRITAQPTNGELNTYCSNRGKRQACRLGDTLVVTFDNLKGWLQQSKIKPSSIYLVLNGREMKSLVCRGPDASYKTLEFDLRQVTDATNADNDNRDTWRTLIAELQDDSHLHVSVGWGDAPPFPSPVDVPFSIFSMGRTVAVIVLLLIMIGGFGLLGARTDILRDQAAVGGIKQPYSLARCQMAWWFFIVLATFCYIWLIINNQDSLTPGALILMGISAATGLAGTVVGGSPDTDAKVDIFSKQMAADRQILQARLDALPKAISALEATEKAALPLAGAAAAAVDSPAMAALKLELMAATVRVKAIDKKGISDGFLLDILRDDEGISFHRFQMVGWTLVLGLIFIVAVYQHLTMPDFSPTLLGLMGISSGTYIGFKISNASST